MTRSPKSVSYRRRSSSQYKGSRRSRQGYRAPGYKSVPSTLQQKHTLGSIYDIEILTERELRRKFHPRVVNSLIRKRLIFCYQSGRQQYCQISEEGLRHVQAAYQNEYFLRKTQRILNQMARHPSPEVQEEAEAIRDFLRKCKEGHRSIDRSNPSNLYSTL